MVWSGPLYSLARRTHLPDHISDYPADSDHRDSGIINGLGIMFSHLNKIGRTPANSPGAYEEYDSSLVRPDHGLATADKRLVEADNSLVTAVNGVDRVDSGIAPTVRRLC